MNTCYCLGYTLTQVQAYRHPGPTLPPRAIRWPHLAILQWVVAVFGMSLSISPLGFGGGVSSTMPWRPLSTASPPLHYKVAPHPLASRIAMTALLIFPTLIPPHLPTGSAGPESGIWSSKSTSKPLAGFQSARRSQAGRTPSCHAAGSRPCGRPTSAQLYGDRGGSLRSGLAQEVGMDLIFIKWHPLYPVLCLLRIFLCSSHLGLGEVPPWP